MKEDNQIIAWSLDRPIEAIRIGYTMTSEDTADEWVELSSGRSKCRMTHHQFNTLFCVKATFPRSIAALKRPIEAKAALDRAEERKRKKELSELARLRSKYPEEGLA